MKSISGKQTASFSIAILTLAITPLWLMLAAATVSAHAQASEVVPNSSTSATTTSSAADWTEFMRDNMQRWNPYETVLNVNNAGGLQLKWIFDSKLPGGIIENSSPAVVNGVFYVGSYDRNVYALDAGTGEKLWSYDTGNFLSSSPAVANGVLYIGTSNTLHGGTVRLGSVLALNAATGARLWSFATTDFVESSPAVANGVVYIGCDNGTLYALSASTGAVLWSFATEGPVVSPPAVANGVVYAASDDYNVYALNAGTGAKLWSFATQGPFTASPAVANGVVYVGSWDNNVYALNATTGAKLWSYDTNDAVISSTAVANGVIYVGSADNVYALNAATGAELWNFATNSTVTSSPAVANGIVYVGSWDSNLYALNATTGAKLWRYTITSIGWPVATSLAVVDGVVYGSGGQLGGSQGDFYAFSVGADLYLRMQPTPTTVHQGDLLTYAFPIWNLGPDNAIHEVLNTQVPAGTTFDYIRISGTPGLGTCSTPPYQRTGQIVCHENASMAGNTTWTVRLTVKVTAPSGTVITENAATMSDTLDPNLANNTATVSTTVQ